MSMKSTSWIVFCALLSTACGNGGAEAPSEAVATAPASDAGPAGKPGHTAKLQGPARIDYKIIGTPVVGQPVGVELTVTSHVGRDPVTLSYRINDATAMQFAEAQPETVALAPASGDSASVQQVRVIPLREGRLFLTVSALVETDSGTLSTATAIPIQVGAARQRATASEDTVTTDENDEAIRVLDGT